MCDKVRAYLMHIGHCSSLIWHPIATLSVLGGCGASVYLRRGSVDADCSTQIVCRHVPLPMTTRVVICFVQCHEALLIAVTCDCR